MTTKNYRNDVQLTDTTPTIITSPKGTKNYPMVMKASHIRENILTAEEATAMGLKADEHIHYHGLGETLFDDVIDNLDEVTLAYRGTPNAEDSTRRENYFLLVSKRTDADGNVINVPVHINQKGQVNQVLVDSNKIATVFGRNDFEEYIKREIQKNNLVRVKTKKASNPVNGTAPIADGYRNDTSSNKNVPLNENSVNKLNSERDSESKILKLEELINETEDELDYVIDDSPEGIKLNNNYCSTYYC